MVRLSRMFGKSGDMSPYLRTMYSGPLHYFDPRIPEDYMDWESIYWQGNISYEIMPTHRTTLNKPDICIRIPYENLYKKQEENLHLKRLRWYFTKMEEHTSSYQWKDTESVPPKSVSLYSGKMLYHFLPPPVNPDAIQPPKWDQDTTYWRGDISYTLEEPDRMHKGCPSVTVNIPEKLVFGNSLTGTFRETGSGGKQDELSLTATDELPIGYVYTNPITTAAADYCLRRIATYFDAYNAELDNASRPVEENGFFYIHRPDATILPRNSAFFARCGTKYYRNLSGMSVEQLPEEELTPPEPCLCIRIQVQLPAGKLKKAVTMLCNWLPAAVEKFVEEFDPAELEDILALAEKQQQIRAFLADSPYCVFLADGSVLPRNRQGGPMPNAIPFVSPDADRVEVAGVPGMAIRRGVTVITGGGYSGKSTLLDAIAGGIYDHVRGDGRELVLTDPTAMEIAAEDGRCVQRANISPFIRWIPGGSPSDFTTAHASGSTSQAANILESVHDGARLLLIDEDRSATNFMIRDRMMKSLIRHEPITPYTDRVRELAENGVSSILVIGGSGEYLGVADRVYRMDDFRIEDATEEAVALWREMGATGEDTTVEEPETTLPATELWQQERVLLADGFSSYPARYGTERLEVDELGIIRIGREVVDIRDIGGLKTAEQQNGAAFLLRTLMVRRKNDTVRMELDEELARLYHQIATEGVECVYSNFFTTCGRFLDLPRLCDVKAIVYRMRHVNWQR